MNRHAVVLTRFGLGPKPLYTETLGACCVANPKHIGGQRCLNRSEEQCMIANGHWYDMSCRDARSQGICQ